MTIIGESLLPRATIEAGYFSMLVSTPATACYAQVFFTSIFSGVVFSSAGFGLSASFTGLAAKGVLS